MKNAGIESVKFDTLLTKLRLDDEHSVTVKELASKRFLDLLHLSATS